MAVKDDKPQAMQTESNLENGSNRASADEKQPTSYLPQSDQDYDVTWKTWIVVWILAWSYGISFWIVPAVAASQAVIATQLGDVSKQAFYIPVYTMTVTIAFMVCGANSDLFGRRWFIIGGVSGVERSFISGALLTTSIVRRTSCSSWALSWAELRRIT
jgi:MFS family permease